MLNRRDLTWVVLGSIILLTATAVLVRSPGYTDAEYYYSIGLQLAEGKGFNQPFVWNFLAQPSPPPQPAHLYWMPLTSIIASLPLAVLGNGFRIVQIIFISIAALLPWLTWKVASRLGTSPEQQRISSALSLFPGFFLPFFVTTDAFALFALLGTATLLSLDRMAKDQRFMSAVIAGGLIGLCQLTRADGLILMLPAAWAIWRAKRGKASLSMGVLLGYMVVFGPWMARLVDVSGSPFPPGASKALWLRNYDELFSYPAAFLSPEYLWGAGWRAIVLARLNALGTNLLSLLLVNHLVFLAPLVAAGAWKFRRHMLVQLAFIYLASLLIVMSVVFPFPGSRGGFFHSSAALMPLIWSLAPPGLAIAIDHVGRRRSWRLVQAKRAFSMGMLTIAAVATGFLAWQRLIRPASSGAGWGSSQKAYQQAGVELGSRDREVGLVAVNNPPGFWLATQLPAVVIPDGGPENLASVAADFGIEWVILESNHPAGLADLYRDPESFNGFEYVGSLNGDYAPPMHYFQKIGSK